jgi:ecotin
LEILPLFVVELTSFDVVDPNAPTVNRFIRLGGAPSLIRYNSRLPVVVYVPEGVDVRYRIWRAEPESKEATEG